MPTQISDDTLLPDIREALMKLEPFENAHAQLVSRIDLELQLGDRLELREHEEHARSHGRQPAYAVFKHGTIVNMLRCARSTCFMWGVPENKVDVFVHTSKLRKGKRCYHAFGGVLASILENHRIPGIRGEVFRDVEVVS